MLSSRHLILQPVRNCLASLNFVPQGLIVMHSSKTVSYDAIQLMWITVKALYFALQLCKMHGCDCMTRLKAFVAHVMMLLQIQPKDHPLVDCNMARTLVLIM